MTTTTTPMIHDFTKCVLDIKDTKVIGLPNNYPFTDTDLLSVERLIKNKYIPTSYEPVTLFNLLSESITGVE